MSVTAPFPWFGGKSRAASLVWDRLGDVGGYVEPFAGSLGVLLGRPETHRRAVETVNDIDGYVVNFWRAVTAAPMDVAEHCSWPVTELDLTARHSWLVNEGADRLGKLQSDPDWYDAKIAGWWVWGCCSWIGSGWCSAEGPWTPEALRGRKLPHLGNAGRGVNRQLPHLGNAGVGDWMISLAERLSRVRVACGDWSRVVTPSASRAGGAPIGIFLDPPYDVEDAFHETYGKDYRGVSAEVREWAIANADDPALRIALCGYDTEHEMPDGWTVATWKARAGYGPSSNTARERIWFSPHCLNPAAETLFGEAA